MPRGPRRRDYRVDPTVRERERAMATMVRPRQSPRSRREPSSRSGEERVARATTAIDGLVHSGKSDAGQGADAKPRRCDGWLNPCRLPAPHRGRKPASTARPAADSRRSNIPAHDGPGRIDARLSSTGIRTLGVNVGRISAISAGISSVGSLRSGPAKRRSEPVPLEISSRYRAKRRICLWPALSFCMSPRSPVAMRASAYSSAVATTNASTACAELNLALVSW
jgi:hypothetical protein